MKERHNKLKLYFSEFDNFEKSQAIKLFMDFENYEFIDNFKYKYPIILIRNIKNDTVFEFKEFLQTYS